MENYKNSKIGQETAQKYGDIIEMERPQTEESPVSYTHLLFALTLVLTVLKVTRTVSLPWLWVLGPLWLGTYRYLSLIHI